MFKFTHTTPTRQTVNSAGADIYAHETIKLEKWMPVQVRTGIKTTLPKSQLLIESRSSMRIRGLELLGVAIINGEIHYSLYSHLSNMQISEGERYAQIVVLDCFVSTLPVFATEYVNYSCLHQLFDTNLVMPTPRLPNEFDILEACNGLDFGGVGIIDADYTKTVRGYVLSLCHPVPTSEPVAYITRAMHQTDKYFPTLDSVRDGGFGSTGL